MSLICATHSSPVFCNHPFREEFDKIQLDAKISKIFLLVLYGSLAYLSALLPLGLLASAVFGGFAIHSLLQLLGTYYRSPPVASVQTPVLPLGELSERHSSGFATENGIDSHEWKLNLIRMANRSILLSGCYCGGRAFDAILDVILEKMRSKPALEVSILSSEMFLTDENRRRIAILNAAFGNRFQIVETAEIFPFLSAEDALSFSSQHTKALIIDYGSAFMLGGSGIVSTWSEQIGTEAPIQNESHGFFYDNFLTMRAFRDVDFVFQSPNLSAGGRFYIEMAKLFERFGGRRLEIGNAVPIAFSEAISNLRLAVYASGPEIPDDRFLNEMIAQVERAQTSIEIGHLYFHPPERLLNALLDASNRGVEITLITNQLSWESPGSHFGHAALSQSFAKSLLEGRSKPNVKLFAYNVPYTSYHKKVIIFDGKTTLLGSSNIGLKSLSSHDYEVNVLVDSEDFAASVQASLESDKLYCIQDNTPDIPLSTSLFSYLQTLCTPFL